MNTNYEELWSAECRAETEAAKREVEASLAVVLPHIQWRTVCGEVAGESMRDVRLWLESCAPHTDEHPLDPHGPACAESRMWHGARLARTRLRKGAQALALQSVGDRHRHREVEADLHAVAVVVAGFAELTPKPAWVLPGDQIWLWSAP